MHIERLARAASRRGPLPDSDRTSVINPMNGLGIVRQRRPSALEAALYEPVLCLILQGEKQLAIGDQTFSVGPGECLLVSHDLPVWSTITKAPYLALVFAVDVATTRELYDKVDGSALDAEGARAARAHQADPGLTDALYRYLALADSPADAKVLGTLTSKEIHYRLLTAPFGGMLRSLIRHDSNASAIARAIGHIRDDIRLPIAVPDLARRVGMSASSFHKQFKTITSTTPLQYQKELRLLEARRVLRTGGASATAVAYEVGYLSPSQFSREYARKFGNPPSHDLANATGAVAVTAAGSEQPIGSADHSLLPYGLRWRTTRPMDRGSMTTVDERLAAQGLDPVAVRATIERAFAEDLGPERADPTSEAIFPLSVTGSADLVARDEGVVAGLAVAEVGFRYFDAGIAFTRHVAEGEAVAAATVLATVTGPVRYLLMAERTVLNLLCRMSGVATHTHQWVRALAATKTTILDTRKTTPGLRMFDKYAVRAAGGGNKRMGLYDAAMIKDNHKFAAGSVTAAFNAVRAARPDIAVQVEVDTLAEAKEAVAAGAEFLLCDNMTPQQLREVVAAVGSNVALEATGNLTLDMAAAYADTGVNYISSGALTHSSPILDIGLDIKQE